MEGVERNSSWSTESLPARVEDIRSVTTSRLLAASLLRWNLPCVCGCNEQGKVQNTVNLILQRVHLQFERHVLVERLA